MDSDDFLFKHISAQSRPTNKAERDFFLLFPFVFIGNYITNLRSLLCRLASRPMYRKQ